ncbi:hypothetical protein GobsT_44800 [Gemmata obscuriglobus]|nr:hypothetical protein GobsT_44800 [Gemmata obscuriglobus]VTS08999.1 unnamed protein product [Gemmata obscuriglobus UQM 2246]
MALDRSQDTLASGNRPRKGLKRHGKTRGKSPVNAYYFGMYDNR